MPTTDHFENNCEGNDGQIVNFFAFIHAFLTQKRVAYATLLTRTPRRLLYSLHPLVVKGPFLHAVRVVQR